MRITKEPEVRKQEIIDTALKLFGEKGYEKTSITDIAKAIGMAQVLCYRYFPSKEALFDSAIEQYADVLVEQMVSPKTDENQTLRQIIESMPSAMEDITTMVSSFVAEWNDRSMKLHHEWGVMPRDIPLLYRRDIFMISPT